VAASGDELKFLDGTTFRLVRSTHDTGGERVEFEISLQPGAPSPPPHFHPSQTEEWHVLAGTLSAKIDGNSRELRESESVTMPPGTVHTLRNRSNDVVRVRDVHIPAGDFQEYIETLHRLSQTGKVKSLRHVPSLIYLSMVVSEHRRRQGQVTASRVQRIGESLLASIGRLLGYKIA
jgi:quercetin dioxygenase-like cupin family protein